MKWGAAGIFVLACGQSAAGGTAPKLAPAQIEYRERALGMFHWAPPPPPPERKSARWGKVRLVAYEAPQRPPEPPALTAPTFTTEDLERRSTLVADWSAHAGPGIAAIQTFGDGLRGVIAYGPGCSSEWLATNVAPIWPALVQHGFLTVHCQGDRERWVWPHAKD